MNYKNIFKKLRKSKRGLTFSFAPTEYFRPGAKYDYELDDENIVIKPSETGKMTVSRKIDGANVKALFDIRSKSVLEKVTAADYIELEVFEKEIVAHICKITSSACCKHDISEVVQCREVETVSFAQELISGGEKYVQLSFFDSAYEQQFKEPLNAIYKVVSLFSGAGMLDYPFKQDARYKILLANDIGKAQAQSYAVNIGNVLIRKDIRELKIIPSADLVLGGPSCKPFSNCNRATRLEEHPDYFLVNEYIRIVKAANPKVFVIENVPEFVTTAEGLLLDNIMTHLDDYTYSVSKVIDCEFGGYTTRKRVIIIGSKIGKISLSPVIQGKMKTVRDALDQVDATWFNFADFSRSNPTTQIRMSYVQDGHNWRDVPNELGVKSQFANYMRRLDPNEQAPTIVNVRKSCIMPPKEYVKGKERGLSVAECSALMGFPKSFKYLGSLDERQQQVANGVPYMIAKAIKNAVTAALTKFTKSLTAPI